MKKINTIPVSIDIEGYLKYMETNAIDILYNGKTGQFLNNSEAREVIACWDSLGHKLMGPPNCEGFDPFGGGCPGHVFPEKTNRKKIRL